MEMTMLRHPKLHVMLRTGSEGSRHDPYAYREYHISTPKGKVVFHSGLGTWLKFNGKEINRPSGWSYDKWEQFLHRCAFEIYTGWTLTQLERIHNRLQSRCRKCGGRDFETVTGHPGEYFEQCVKCGHINGGYFCESEII